MNTKISLTLLIFGLITIVTLVFRKKIKIGHNKADTIEKSRIIFFKPFDYNRIIYEDYLISNNLDSKNFSYNDYKGTGRFIKIMNFFSAGKSIDYLKWEIFASCKGIRLKKLYSNADEIDEYFKKKYNKYFFYGQERSVVRFEYNSYYNKKEGINFDDFKKIILPNFKMDFFQEVDTNPSKEKQIYSVFFNWDFFLDININPSINPIYNGYTEVYNSSDLFCFVFGNFFVSSMYSPDVYLKGLTFNDKPELNSIMNKYFHIESDAYFPYVLRAKKNWYCSELKERKRDLSEIFSYFENINRPICKIYKDNELTSISSFYEK